MTAAIVLALALQDPEVELRARLLAGYDTNVLGVSHDADLVDDAPRASFVAGVDAVVRAWVEAPEWMLGVECANAARILAAEPGLSFTDSVFALAARASPVDALDVRIRASVSDAHLAGDGHFRTLRSFEPSLEWRNVVAWAAAGDADYYGDQERDGRFRLAGLGWRHDFEAWTLRLDFRFLDVEAEGAEHDRCEWQPGIVVTAPPIFDVVPSLALAFTAADYESSRLDRRLAVTLSLAHGSGLRLSVRFEDARSNRDEFTFTRWQSQIECEFLVARF